MALLQFIHRPHPTLFGAPSRLVTHMQKTIRDQLRRKTLPEKRTIQRARKAAREGKKPTTQAGEFVHEEIKHVREGKHGARSTKQAIAIGLSKARRAGVKLRPPKKGTTSAASRKRAERDYEHGRTKKRTPSKRRSRASMAALRKESRRAASHTALSRHARKVARKK